VSECHSGLYYVVHTTITDTTKLSCLVRVGGELATVKTAFSSPQYI